MDLNYTEMELIDAIQQGGRRLDEVMEFIYHHPNYRHSIIQFIQSKNGSLSDAEDVFQDGIRHLIINVRNGQYEHKSSIQTYLSVICKNIWHTKLNRVIKLKAIKSAIAEEKITIDTPESQLILSDRARLLESIIVQVGEECKKVLSLWSLGYSFKEIGIETGKKEGAVRKQKYTCFHKVMSLLKNRPDLLIELKNL